MLTSTRAQVTARSVLNACLAGKCWQASDVDALLDDPSGALFTIVAEGLADRFEPHLNDSYADIFSYAISRVTGLSNSMLRERYERVRRGYCRAVQPKMVVLLSRVTIGADIVITSVIARALRHRFPGAQLYLAGAQNSADLLGLPAIPVIYPREGTLAQRITAMNSLRELGDQAVIVDPDSRMTQLGLLPITSEDRYCFFESRGYMGNGPILQLTKKWCAEALQTPVHGPLILPGVVSAFVDQPVATVSLGVGGNERKRLDGTFERDLIQMLSRRTALVIVDKGSSAEEAARVTRATAGVRNVRLHHGKFTDWAGTIAHSDLYVGYDSAGQHAAAALGVPTVSLVAGGVCERFYERWRPSGSGRICVIRCDNMRRESVLAQAVVAAERLARTHKQ